MERGALFSSTPQPQLARSPISIRMVGGIIVLCVSEAVNTFTLWEHWRCRVVHLARGALEPFQQQQVYIKTHILKENGDRYLLTGLYVHQVELRRGFNGLWIAHIERCFHCELGFPVEVQMASDLLRIK